MTRFHSFFWLNNISLCVHVYIYTHTYTKCVYILTHTHTYIRHIFLIYSSISGYLGCFHILAIINNAPVNMRMQASFQVSVFIFLGQIPRGKINESHSGSFLVFWGTSTWPSVIAVNLHSHQQRTKVSLFSTSLLTPTISCLFDSSYSNIYEVISYCGFDLHFPAN